MGSATKALQICILLFAVFSFVASNTCILGGLRTDCCPGGCTQAFCESKGCCFNPASAQSDGLQGIPWCFHQNPPVMGYEVASMTNTPNGLTGTLKIYNGSSTFGTDIPTLRLSVFMETESRIHIKITDANAQRWEVPNVIQSTTPAVKPNNVNYEFTYTNKPFGFAVKRKSNNEVIFNTTSNPNSPFNGLIFKDQYIEFSSQFDSRSIPNIYGLGERISSLRLPLESYYTLFAADRGTPTNTNLYGVHPFYLSHNSATLSSNGVFLLNSNGMDIYLGNHSITYKTIGGVIDLFIFTGTTPAQVINQYHQVIGTPYLPPLWSLGFHQCRWGYNTIDDVSTVVDQYRKNNIPLETIWNDIDYMQNYYGFTYDPVRYPIDKVHDFVNMLNKNHQHYVVITECGIPKPDSANPNYPVWNDAVNMNVFIKNPDNRTEFLGKVWPGITSWPSYVHPNVTSYWSKQIEYFLSNLAGASGLWLDMNEASNFCDGSCTSEMSFADYVEKRLKFIKDRDTSIAPAKQSVTVKSGSGFDPVNPPYPINNGNARQPLNTKAIAMNAIDTDNIQYNTHSLYGTREANVTRIVLEKLRNKRAFVLSRSSYAGHGRYAAHWLGDNVSDYDDLYYSIPGILAFQMFGVPLVGADICGFGGKSNEQLCARWIELGAFYPFSRDHNAIGSPSQELYVWPAVAAASRTVLAARYSLLPYYYTLFAQAHRFGGGVWNPLFFEFYNDTNTFGIDKQFLIGKHISICPVLVENATTVSCYFPPSDTFYDFWTGNKQTLSGYVRLNAPLNYIPIHVRSGSIIPMYNSPQLTIYDTQQQSKIKIIATFDKSGKSEGRLYMDDGESLGTVASGRYVEVEYEGKVNGTEGKIEGRVIKNGWKGEGGVMIWDEVEVWGNAINGIGYVKANGRSLEKGKNWSVVGSKVKITGMGLQVGQSNVITWGV